MIIFIPVPTVIRKIEFIIELLNTTFLRTVWYDAHVNPFGIRYTFFARTKYSSLKDFANVWINGVIVINVNNNINAILKMLNSFSM